MARVAFIGTGGTISSLGANPLDILDYGAQENMLDAAATLESVPEVQEVAEVFALPFASVGSPKVYFAQWKELVSLCASLVADHPDLAGIVIGHGTASLEETAYFLGLTLKVGIPVVVVGSQRPMSGLSTDAKLNLVNAVRTAASPASVGRGVLVLLNDEIHAAREVTKTATTRLQTFKVHDFGMLGYVDGAHVSYYRSTERRTAPDTESTVSELADLPRVDVAYSYAGADGAAIDAFVAAGAKGIISAGFAPGGTTDMQRDALVQAKAAGVVIVWSTRAGSGVVHIGTRLGKLGFLSADNLNPQKARILLSLALTISSDPDEIVRIFATY